MRLPNQRTSLEMDGTPDLPESLFGELKKIIVPKSQIAMTWQICMKMFH